ncbi:MAG: hypothetical protein ACJ75Z_06345 [Solirubrobacterales bacterium]
MVSRFARRSRFLAQRLWLVAGLEVAWLARRHWRRLEPEERRRLLELARRSRGRPSRLSERERREAAELLEKVDYAEFGGNVAGTLLPFRPFARLVEYVLGRPMRSRRRDAADA